jgi:small-conductance mechanosensitive channel
MKRRNPRFSCIAVFIGLWLAACTAHGITVPTVTPEQGATATESDATPPAVEQQVPTRAPVMVKWLHLLDTNADANDENSSVLAFGPKVPGDIFRVLKTVGGPSSAWGFWKVLFLALVSIALGFLVLMGVKRYAGRGIAKLAEVSPPAGTGMLRFWAGVVRSIPDLVSIIVLTLSSTIIFLLLAGGVGAEGRMFFQLILGFVVFTKLCSFLGRIIFAPQDQNVRPLPVDDFMAGALYRAAVIATSVILSGRLLVNFIFDLGALRQSVTWMAILIGTSIIAILAVLVIYLKAPVSEALRKNSVTDGQNWIREQLNAHWHVPTLLYLVAVWFIWIGQQLSGTISESGSFIISLFIVPIYLALSFAGRSVIRSVIDSLGVASTHETDSGTGEGDEATDRQQQIESKSYLIYRVILLFAVAVWTLTLWGYDIPFAARAISAIFQSLITIALALMIWRVASSYIARKIEEAAPDPAELVEDEDNEFGGAAPASRSTTLLPMLRKVLASTLIIMVGLIVLSSLGVNITPILAGAGVVGLAVGFGAQKLVSDILSGFFFLLDDAFRVGEYIQAGSIKGTVENITLRNVMLRHHLGMLQIVPHSDLGAITNSMRGGIVIKFPLEFAYDVDIEKVRKIIKKVGQKMLEDDELKDDFILPLKSQGVYEIANSVMTIRVKFTSKPGKQFVIKREAFRRITEALKAAGIHYAHRKVIVDFPEEANAGTADEQARRKALEAGAAAKITADIEQEKQATAAAEQEK